MSGPRQLSDIKFHGGEICYAWLPDFDTPLEGQKERLDRTLIEVFYPKVVLDVGYYDETGLADGYYPDGEFRVRIHTLETHCLLHEWRTRDTATLYKMVSEAARLAPTLRPTS